VGVTGKDLLRASARNRLTIGEQKQRISACCEVACPQFIPKTDVGRYSPTAPVQQTALFPAFSDARPKAWTGSDLAPIVTVLAAASRVAPRGLPPAVSG